MKAVVVLGATGSIGVSTLDVLARHPQRFSVLALTAQSQVERLFQQCLAHGPRYAVMADGDAAERLRERVREAGLDTEVLAGVQGLVHVATLAQADYVVAAIVGAAGLRPTLAAAAAGKRVLLANKEALVMAGALFMEAVRRGGAELLPVDSEHNAIFQCLPPGFPAGLAAAGVRRILLTASGGPFRRTAVADLAAVTPEQAVAHPNWAMGPKISVDSATMMNKGLEVIEAHWLFNAAPGQIEVILHPQSIVHSMVEFVDGSVLAQLGNPDMRTPIAHALAWPERLESGVSPLDLLSVGRLEFEAPEPARFPCLGLAMQALRAGGTAPAVLNAANEVAVQAFLERRLPFVGIAGVIESVLQTVGAREPASLNDVLDDDAAARDAAGREVAIRGGAVHAR